MNYCHLLICRAPDVKRHLTTHTGEKPYECTICKCRFTQSYSLANHMRIKHSSEKNKSLEKEPAVPSDEKPYLCNLCGKRFRHRSTLNMHIKRQLDVRPFECHICKLR